MTRVRTLLIALSFTMLATPTGPVASELGDAMMDCAAIESRLERLSCFDRLTRESTVTQSAAPAAPASTEAEARVATPVPAPQPARKMENHPIPLAARKETEAPAARAGDSEFGLAEGSRGQVMRAAIVGKRKLAHGQWVLTLNNGQVWRELEPKRRARYREGDNITIRRKLMSYRLINDRTGFSNSVRRLK